MKRIMDICQLSPHSVAWLLAFMIGLGIVVRGRVQVPSLNAGINSGGLIWIGPYRRETETSGNIVCSPMELSPLCSVDKWRMQSRAISPLAGGSDGSQGCQMLSESKTVEIDVLIWISLSFCREILIEINLLNLNGDS